MSVYIKGMEMPVDCLACRIACDKESYGVIGRPPKCPLTEAKTGNMISMADAIEAIIKVGHEHVEEKVIPLGAVTDYLDAIKALPSAEAEPGEWILVKGSNGKDYHKCSKCLHTQEITGVKNYCAVCGTRMKGGDDE